MNLEKFITDNSIEIIDIRYSSLDERSRSISFPSEKLNYFIENRVGVDGSYLGIKSEKKSDMVVKPELNRYYIDPFSEFSSLILFGELHSTDENEEFDGDPRRILKKTISLISEKGIAIEIEILPESEFYIFDECYFESSKLYRIVDIRVQNGSSQYNGYHVDYPFDLNKDFRMNLFGKFKAVGIEFSRYFYL